MFEKRFLEWEGDPNQIPTKDKRFIWVTSYARWRINDPLLFFRRLHDEQGTQSRLDDILDGEMRKGKADAEAADIYAAAYNRDPDFYRFLKSMQTLEDSFDPDTVLLLSTDSELLRYLNSAK